MDFTVDVEMTSTGLGYFPGLAEPVTIRSAELSGEDAATLSKLVAEADFFALPSEVRGRSSHPDAQQYKITICEDGEKERCHTVELDYPAADPAQQELLESLRGMVKAKRVASSATPEPKPDGNP